jgi:hypothetical protein
MRPEPTLVDLLTGATTVLPRFRENDHGLINWLMEKSRGVVYSDGTIFVYSIGACNFTAAILRPGDVAWTIAENNFGSSCNSSAAYHDGKILVCINLEFWFVLMPDFNGNGRAGGGSFEMSRDTGDASYIFESGNELMWATVKSKPKPSLGCRLSVTLRALVGPDSGGKMRLVARDGQSFRDRVLFLGSPASFTAKATHLGGFAYFVFNRCLHRYNLINGVDELMERVRPGWGSDRVLMWLQPHELTIPKCYQEN